MPTCAVPTAWCGLRQAFRSFRVDRIEQLEVLDEHFRSEPGQALADRLRAVGRPSV
jgi:predicted DNA-binding transcriptional regulator YafY